MRRRLKQFIFTLILVCLANPAFAFTEYYVDFENGSDTATACTDAASDECKTLQYALDTVTVDAGGSRINVEWDSAAMTQTLAATIDIDTNAGSPDNPIIVQGYQDTVGDGTKAIIDGDSAAADCINVNEAVIVLRDLELKGATDDAVNVGVNGDDATLIDLLISGAGDEGINIASGANRLLVINCEITGTTDDGALDDDADGVWIYNNFHDITGKGILFSGGGGKLIHNIIDTTQDHNLSSSQNRLYLIGNTMYNAVLAGKDNINIGAAGENQIIINNILNTSNGDSLVLEAGSNAIIYGYNAIETKSGTILIDLGGEQTLDPQFTNAGDRDFNIGANLDDLGFPITWVGATDTTGNMEQGVAPYEETGNGSVTVGYGNAN